MSVAHVQEVLVPARAGGRGVGAFNVISLEHAEAVVAGAEAAGHPVILQLSENAVRFHGGRLGPIAAAMAAVASGAAVPVALHLDHVEDEALLAAAAGAGFSSVMFDASDRPDAENAATTRAAADRAHAAGLWLEGELGAVGGKDGVHAPGPGTDPGAAAAYVEAAGVDSLAVAVGSSHKMTDRSARIDHARVAELRAAVGVPLVLHGSSGVAEDELRRAVAAGITKVNVGTLLNVAFTGAVRAALAADPGLVDPRPYLAAGRTATAGVVERTVAVLAGP